MVSALFTTPTPYSLSFEKEYRAVTEVEIYEMFRFYHTLLAMSCCIGFRIKLPYHV